MPAPAMSSRQYTAKEATAWWIENDGNVITLMSSTAGGQPVGAHNSVVGADQGFRAPSWDQESARDSVHDESASARIRGRSMATAEFPAPTGPLCCRPRPADLKQLWCSDLYKRPGTVVSEGWHHAPQKSNPFRYTRNPLQTTSYGLQDPCNFNDLGLTHRPHEGGGCAISCANCADRSRSWRLEASRALLGGIRREIRVDRARRLRVTGGEPRSFPVWVSQPVMRLRPSGPGASLFAGADAHRTIGSCQHRCGCDTRPALLSAHGSDM